MSKKKKYSNVQENKNTVNNKQKLTFIILMTFICLILIIGITYAFIRFIIGGSNNNFIGIRTVTVDYIDGQTIKNQNLQLPILESEVENYSVKHRFSAYNSGDNNAYITIKLTDITLDNEIANDENLRYTLYSGSNKISTGSFNETNNGTLILGKDIPVTAGSTEEFGISIWIRENGGNQNHFLNKSISGKINIEGTDKQLTYKDNSGANEPDLLSDSLIPVIYDEESDKWLKADIHKKWYDYDEQWWANAVTVSTSTRDSYKAMSPNEPIEMSDIETMWVWIPRYSYDTSNLGKNYAGGTKALPGGITIKFDSGVNKLTSDDNYTHPAFTFGIDELTGLWVAKFEMSSDCLNNPKTKSTTNCTSDGGFNVTTEKLLIKPDMKSWRNIQISNIFTVSRTLSNKNNTYGITNTADSHMIKNTEWGSVVYLSQSKYGKYGNKNYTGTNKEVYVNNSGWGFYTGRSSGKPTSSTSNVGTYSYNDKACSAPVCTGEKTAYKGTGASTTGNIYGIYDMAGGSVEYVLGNYNNTESGVYKGWFSNTNTKFYDKYTCTNVSSCYIKGDATYETSGWYSSYQSSSFVSSNNPWFTRNGLFYYSSYAGTRISTTSSRPVLVK